MKYCILVDTNQIAIVNGQRTKVPSLFLLEANIDKPRLFDSEDDAHSVLTELRKDPVFAQARIEAFHE